jgi:hypothetical protein
MVSYLYSPFDSAQGDCVFLKTVMLGGVEVWLPVLTPLITVQDDVTFKFAVLYMCCASIEKGFLRIDRRRTIGHKKTVIGWITVFLLRY